MLSNETTYHVHNSFTDFMLGRLEYFSKTIFKLIKKITIFEKENFFIFYICSINPIFMLTFVINFRVAEHNYHKGKLFQLVLCARKSLMILTALEENIYLFKINNRTSLWCFYCQLWTYFTSFSRVFIVGFEQVNVSWASTSSS